MVTEQPKVRRSARYWLAQVVGLISFAFGWVWWKEASGLMVLAVLALMAVFGLVVITLSGAKDTQGLTALMRAAAYGNLARLSEMLASGANPNERDGAGATALMYAVRNGQLGVVEALIGAGADVSATNNKGSSAEAIAKRFKKDDVLALLQHYQRAATPAQR